MNTELLVRRLEHFPRALEAVTAGLTDDELIWKPEAQVWSIMEVCGHLLDEEREDFRVRLKSTLEEPEKAWPALGLDNVAEQRGYNRLRLAPTLAAFAEERAASLRWLFALDEPDWNTAHPHPKFGPIRAGDLLASWAKHDALHLKQIAKRLAELADHDAEPFKTDYAG